jgi:hypothetical protein
VEIAAEEQAPPEKTNGRGGFYNQS